MTHGGWGVCACRGGRSKAEAVDARAITVPWRPHHELLARIEFGSMRSPLYVNPGRPVRGREHADGQANRAGGRAPMLFACHC